MRTFHIGGAASRAAAVDNVAGQDAPARCKFNNLQDRAPRRGPLWSRCRAPANCRVIDAHGRERERYKVPYGAVIDVEGRRRGQGRPDRRELGSAYPSDRPEVAGVIRFIDFIDGITVQEQIDELTGLASAVVTDPKRRGTRRRTCARCVQPGRHEGQASSASPSTDIPAQYFLPAGAIVIAAGRRCGVASATSSRVSRRKRSKTRDITGGLPRVADLFEARKPKDSAILAERSGIVSFGKDTKGKQRLIITDATATSTRS